MLTELEKDALTELINIAVSGAAVRLRAMVGSEVKLTVPAVSVIGSSDAARTMHALGLTNLTAVSQSFSGLLQGETMLVFPDGNEGNLVRAVLGSEMSDAEVANLTNDALGEIGNVLLLGFLSTIGDHLDVTFGVSIPTVVASEPNILFKPDDQKVALFIYVNFSISGHDVRGYFGLILGVETFVTLREILAAFIEKVGG